MPSKSKPLTKAELAAFEAKRDLAAELLQSVREMKAGKVRWCRRLSSRRARAPGCRSLSSRYSLECQFARCNGAARSQAA